MHLTFRALLLPIVMVASSPVNAADLAGPGIQTNIIASDSRFNGLAYRLQRFLCYMKHGDVVYTPASPSTSTCPKVTVRTEISGETINRTANSAYIYLGRHPNLNSGYVNSKISQKLNALTNEDSFIWASLAADQSFIIASRDVGVNLGTDNGVYALLEKYGGILLTLPTPNVTLTTIHGLLGPNDVVPQSSTPLAIPDSDLTGLDPAVPGLKFLSQGPAVEQRLFSTDFYYSPGQTALPPTYKTTHISSPVAGKQTITHMEPYLLRPNLLPDGTIPPANYNANPEYYSSKPTIPALKPLNANDPFRPCYSTLGTSNDVTVPLATGLLLHHAKGSGLSMGISDSGGLCPNDTTLANCNHDNGSTNISNTSLSTTDKQARSAACHYFRGLKGIDSLLHQQTYPRDPKINILMHGYLRTYDLSWRFNFSSYFRSIFFPSDEAQALDPSQWAEQFGPDSVIAGASKTLPTLGVGIYNYIAEPNFLIPRYFPTDLHRLLTANYNHSVGVTGMYSEFYPNPGSITDAIMGHLTTELSWNPKTPSGQTKTLSSIIEKYTNLIFPGVETQMRQYLSGWEGVWSKQFQTNPSDPKLQRILKLARSTGQPNRSLYRWMGDNRQLLFLDPPTCASQLAILQNASNLSTGNVQSRVKSQISLIQPICDLSNIYHSYYNGQLESDLPVGYTASNPLKHPLDLSKYKTIFQYLIAGSGAEVNARLQSVYPPPSAAPAYQSPMHPASKTMHIKTLALRPWEALSALARKFTLNLTNAPKTQAQLSTLFKSQVQDPLNSPNALPADISSWVERVKPVVVEALTSAPNLDPSSIGPEWGSPQISQNFMNTDQAQYGSSMVPVTAPALMTAWAQIHLKTFNGETYVAIQVGSPSPMLAASLPAPTTTPTPFTSNNAVSALQASTYKTSRQFLRVIMRNYTGITLTGNPDYPYILNEPQVDYLDINSNGHISFNHRGVRTDLIQGSSFAITGCSTGVSCKWISKFKIKNQAKALLSSTNSYNYPPILSPAGYRSNTDLYSGTEINAILWNGAAASSLFPNGFEYANSADGTWLNYPNTFRGYPVIMPTSP